jgi:hypothetical protein
MQSRKIAVGMIEETYDAYRNDWMTQSSGELSYELNKFDIPVWNNMSDNTKQSCIEYVYNNRDTIELHSGLCASWVQATAYFMIFDFASLMGENPEIEMFFDDLDFMMDSDTLTDENVQEQMGIPSDFTEKF